MTGVINGHSLSLISRASVKVLLDCSGHPVNDDLIGFEFSANRNEAGKNRRMNRLNTWRRQQWKQVMYLFAAHGWYTSYHTGFTPIKGASLNALVSTGGVLLLNHGNGYHS